MNKLMVAVLVLLGSANAQALGQMVVAFSCVGENGMSIVMDGRSYAAVASHGSQRTVFQVAPSVLRVQQGIGPVTSLIQLQVPGSRASAVYDIELEGELMSGRVMLVVGKLRYAMTAPIMSPNYPGPQARPASSYQAITDLFCQVLVR